MIQSSGNGKSNDPEIGVNFEPLDDETQQVQDRWVRDDGTGKREISFGDDLREELRIEEDDESESD